MAKKSKKPMTPEARERYLKQEADRREREKVKIAEEKRVAGAVHKFFCVLKPPRNGDELRAEAARRFRHAHGYTEKG